MELIITPLVKDSEAAKIETQTGYATPEIMFSSHGIPNLTRTKGWEIMAIYNGRWYRVVTCENNTDSP